MWWADGFWVLLTMRSEGVCASLLCSACSVPYPLSLLLKDGASFSVYQSLQTQLKDFLQRAFEALLHSLFLERFRSSACVSLTLKT